MWKPTEAARLASEEARQALQDFREEVRAGGTAEANSPATKKKDGESGSRSPALHPCERTLTCFVDSRAHGGFSEDVADFHHARAEALLELARYRRCLLRHRGRLRLEQGPQCACCLPAPEDPV